MCYLSISIMSIQVLTFDPTTVDYNSYDNLWDMAHQGEPYVSCQDEQPTKAQLKALAYDKAIKRCTLKSKYGLIKVQFWTVDGGYSPFTITDGKKQYFKTVDSMRKRYIMLIKQGYTLVK